MSKRTASVIFLHGLGDSGAGWSDLQQEAPLPWARWSFPDAQNQPVSCNMGMSMPSWFDLQELPLGDAESAGAPRGIDKAVSMVHAMLRQSESLGFAPERTVLGGFSQGAALSLLAGLTYEKPLAGIIALSGWAMKRRELARLIRHKDVPVFIGHGKSDPTVPCSLGTAAEQTLKASGCTKVQLHLYPNLGHSACPQEFHEIHSFLRTQLPEAWTAPTPRNSVQDAAFQAAAKTQVVVKRPMQAAQTASNSTPEYVMTRDNGKISITINVPNVEASDLEVDLAPLILRVGGAHCLELELPCRVDPEGAISKYSKRRGQLSIQIDLQGDNSA